MTNATHPARTQTPTPPTIGPLPDPAALDERKVGWLPALCHALDQQLTLASLLREHSTRQSELLTIADYEAVAGVLLDRQPIVDAMQSTARALEPLTGRMGEFWPKLDAAQREAVSGRVAELQSILDAVRDQDERDRVALENHRNAIADELVGLDRGRSALGAYDPAAAEQHEDDAPRFQDREG